MIDNTMVKRKMTKGQNRFVTILERQRHLKVIAFVSKVTYFVLLSSFFVVGKDHCSMMDDKHLLFRAVVDSLY
jgi:hypothetical protein